MNTMTGVLLPDEPRTGVCPVLDAIHMRSLCCNCLVATTGLTALRVRRSLLLASRVARLNTWTPCQVCGAVDETYQGGGAT